MSGGGREQGGLDLRSPVRISDFVLAPPTVFADRWQSGETLTRRSPAIWRCRRIDLGEVLVQVPPARGAGVEAARCSKLVPFIGQRCEIQRFCFSLVSTFCKPFHAFVEQPR